MGKTISIKTALMPAKERIRSQKDTAAFKTGFSAIDSHEPIVRGRLTIIAGVHNMGKTTLALNIITNNAIIYGEPAAILTSATSSSIAERTAEIYFGEPINQMDPYMAHNFHEIEHAPFYICTADKYSFDKVTEDILETYGSKGVKIFIIDDISLLGKAKKISKKHGREPQLAKLDELANKLNITLILLVPLHSRDFCNRSEYRPTLDDLRNVLQTPFIYNDVRFLYRNSYYYCTDDTSAELISANKTGPKDEFCKNVFCDTQTPPLSGIKTAVQLNYNGTCGKFSDPYSDTCHYDTSFFGDELPF